MNGLSAGALGAVFGAALTAATVAAAASGDAIYEEVVEVTLNASQRTALGTFVGNVWNGATADVQAVSCRRETPGSNVIICGIRGEKSGTPAQVLDLLTQANTSVTRIVRKVP